jgi:hypothetical protein
VLADSEPPFALLYVHGPGGVGKTLLLGEFARLASVAGVPAVRLDGRDGGDPTALAPEQRPDVVRALLGRFVQQLPGPATARP